MAKTVSLNRPQEEDLDAIDETEMENLKVELERTLGREAVEQTLSRDQSYKLRSFIRGKNRYKSILSS
jgi:hypothetical protein